MYLNQHIYACILTSKALRISQIAADSSTGFPPVSHSQHNQLQVVQERIPVHAANRVRQSLTNQLQIQKEKCASCWRGNQKVSQLAWSDEFYV